jgi:AraC family transcriptional regulator
MIESGAYGERMAGYLHLSQPPLYGKLGSGHSELSVTRLHAPKGFSEPTSSIPIEKAFSIHLHLRATSGGRLWLGGKLFPTPKRPSGGVTILDLEEEPIAFFRMRLMSCSSTSRAWHSKNSVTKTNYL